MSNLSQVEQFALNWHFADYPTNLSFEGILSAYAKCELNEEGQPLVVSHNRYESSLNRKSETVIIRFLAIHLLLRQIQNAHQLAWQTVIDFYFDSYGDVSELIRCIHNDLSIPDGTYLREEYKAEDWSSICNLINELVERFESQLLTAHEQAGFIDRLDFMSLFRCDEVVKTLTPADREEIFLSILLGKQDITVELLNRLLSDYDVAHLQVIEIPNEV